MDQHQDTSINSKCCRFEWSWEENKAFETALAINLGENNYWEKISSVVPERTIEEIKNHFEVLYADVNAIESGFVSWSGYDGSFKKPKLLDHAIPDGKNEKSKEKIGESSNEEEGSSRSYGKEGRRKPWSLEEHKLFLDGVKKYGRGDWKTISKEFVLSRTPAQLNSHAQKFFVRYKSRSDFVKKMTDFYGFTTNDYGMFVNSRVDNGGNGASSIGTLIPKGPIPKGPRASRKIVKITGEMVPRGPTNAQKTKPNGSGSSDSWINKFGASAYDFSDPNQFMDMEDVLLFFSRSD